jgi:WD repeat-containing protein 55
MCTGTLLLNGAIASRLAENTDFIADMLYTEHKGNTLAVGSGDGCLSVFDLRAGRLLARSDQQDDELLSLALVKSGRKLVCGCQVTTAPANAWCTGR